MTNSRRNSRGPV